MERIRYGVCSVFVLGVCIVPASYRPKPLLGFHVFICIHTRAVSHGLCLKIEPSVLLNIAKTKFHCTSILFPVQGFVFDSYLPRLRSFLLEASECKHVILRLSCALSLVVHI